jgi:hypothetical protein
MLMRVYGYTPYCSNHPGLQRRHSVNSTATKCMKPCRPNCRRQLVTVNLLRTSCTGLKVRTVSWPRTSRTSSMPPPHSESTTEYARTTYATNRHAFSQLMVTYSQCGTFLPRPQHPAKTPTSTSLRDRVESSLFPTPVDHRFPFSCAQRKTVLAAPSASGGGGRSHWTFYLIPPRTEVARKLHSDVHVISRYHQQQNAESCSITRANSKNVASRIGSGEYGFVWRT